MSARHVPHSAGNVRCRSGVTSNLKRHALESLAGTEHQSKSVRPTEQKPGPSISGPSRHVNGLFEHIQVTDMVGKRQNQSGIQQLAL